MTAIFEIFQIWTRYISLERISPPFPYLKHLQAIEPSFLTKLSSNEIRETYEGPKLLCKLFEINAQQDFWKLIIFSISSKHFIEPAHGNSSQFCLASVSDLGILCCFPQGHNRNNGNNFTFLKNVKRDSPLYSDVPSRRNRKLFMFTWDGAEIILTTAIGGT